jgi:hypothetical protein
LIPGLVAAYLRLVAADSPSPLPLPRFDARLVPRLAILSAASVSLIYVVVRLFARFG